MKRAVKKKTLKKKADADDSRNFARIFNKNAAEFIKKQIKKNAAGKTPS